MTVSAKTATKKIAPKKSSAVAKLRRKSKLVIAGEAAQRGLLLITLKECGWNLTRAAAVLDMRAPEIIRSIKTLGLQDEYEAAKTSGLARPGRPRAE